MCVSMSVCVCGLVAEEVVHVRVCFWVYPSVNPRNRNFDRLHSRFILRLVPLDPAGCASSNQECSTL